jgi:hypothetical protein
MYKIMGYNFPLKNLGTLSHAPMLFHTQEQKPKVNLAFVEVTDPASC